jgi:hypothetical protein
MEKHTIFYLEGWNTYDLRKIYVLFSVRCLDVHAYLWQKMEVSGQLSALATLTLWEELLNG